MRSAPSSMIHTLERSHTIASYPVRATEDVQLQPSLHVVRFITIHGLLDAISWAYVFQRLTSLYERHRHGQTSD